MVVFTTLLFLVLGIAFIYMYSRRHFNYWKARHVSGPVPLAFIGNILDICTAKICIGDFLKSLYASYDNPVVGIFIFDEPCLLVRSVELVKNILVKDYSHFKDRPIAAPKHDDIFAKIMFVDKSPSWKNIRSKVNSVFTIAKIQNMFTDVADVTRSFVDYLNANRGNHNAANICLSYTVDVIVKCFFGINAHSFDDENAQFKNVALEMQKPTLRNAFSQTSYFFKTGLVNVLRLTFFKREVQEFFINTFLRVVDEREAINFEANDFITSVTKIGKEDPSFDRKTIAAQAMQLFQAGVETTATTLAFTMHELALNPDIQKKLREEILSVTEQYGGVTYEAIKEMKYLDMCMLEALRKYPPLPFLDRRCDTDYNIPGSNLVIQKGIAVYIPIMAIQMDEKYFPEPEIYNPDRFTRNVNERDLIHIPFGYGPRICIGKRFGEMTVKLGLAHILTNCSIQRVPETPSSVKFQPKNFTLQSKVGLPVRVEPISR